MEKILNKVRCLCEHKLYTSPVQSVILDSTQPPADDLYVLSVKDIDGPW